MNELGFGRFEHLLIASGALILEPWPVAIRTVKFGSAGRVVSGQHIDFDLDKQVSDFFAYVRAVERGEILCLEVRYGGPLLMEITTVQPESR